MLKTQTCFFVLLRSYWYMMIYAYVWYVVIFQLFIGVWWFYDRIHNNDGPSPRWCPSSWGPLIQTLGVFFGGSEQKTHGFPKIVKQGSPRNWDTVRKGYLVSSMLHVFSMTKFGLTDVVKQKAWHWKIHCLVGNVWGSRKKQMPETARCAWRKKSWREW